jgi:hypothetical protein
MEFPDENVETTVEPENLAALLAEREAALAEAIEQNRLAANRLREVLLAHEPALDPELVHGETVAEVEASFDSAVSLLGRLRERLRHEQAPRVPAGAPPRGSGNAALTPFEKIREGLSRSR